jgi:hypothetical protein
MDAAEMYYKNTPSKPQKYAREGESMRSDRDRTGMPPRRTPWAPVPGTPYRLHTDKEDDPSAVRRRDIEFIESRPASGRRDTGGDAYNSWEELGWQGGETAFPVTQEPQVLQEEQYFKPMLDLDRELPDAYGEPGEYAQREPPPELIADEPEFFQEPPPPPPLPKKERRKEPWRTAVILCCVAGLLFCAVEVYRIARDVLQSDAELKEYRELYLTEHNEDFSANWQAVALRPPGETYPPTASPVPMQTPTPTPRIAQNDPLIAAMSSGLATDQSVAPETPAPPARYTLERYPDNPLLIVRDDIAALQAENPDIVGRLIIDGVLNEIVVKRNNTYYLNHSAMDIYSGYGAVFADENIVFSAPPENILLFGRTSNEGRTFAPLKDYISQGLDFAGRHAFLSFNSLYEEARYVIIGIVKSSSDPAAADYFDYQRTTFATDGEMLAFASEAIGRSQYEFNAGVIATDRLLTLVTLSDGTDQSRIVIVCRMLRDGEYDGYLQNDATAAP